MTACADGRWFAFSASLDLVCILEKKTVPEHLMELSALDRPVFLRKILAELEDHGEVTQHEFDSKKQIFLLQNYVYNSRVSI